MRLPFSRRSFLKASLLTTLAFLHPGTTQASFLPKKQPSGRLNLYNIHTGEKLNTTYRDPDGTYNPQAINELNRLLRCHHTNEQHPIDLQTLDFLDQVNTQLGSTNEIHVISGFRSPKYNDYLISKGHKVAKHSLHLEGRAIDIRIPGTALSTLQRTALSFRLGGVGYYPSEDFVHIDSGSFRTW
ncbi:YcbK family protein [Thiovibrio frasassiensis]|jgi:uncharacterized protein YcbK (DUF882 family)|uniref:Murein endopeptidase K n=1 Tax=Thiovibrio frasassiensis TaxID=2984131 RepID=A0A9X4RKK8_9BACT|nr:DUF882 domain-containing protein [Thiovibrio frasassiensis]MDG4475131.1 DUF882 domain-containing protein [Thiovibrio frasassiensis]